MSSNFVCYHYITHPILLFKITRNDNRPNWTLFSPITITNLDICVVSIVKVSNQIFQLIINWTVKRIMACSVL